MFDALPYFYWLSQSFVVRFIKLPKTSIDTTLQYKSFENTVGKGEIARNEQYLFYQQCFLPV